MWRRRRAMTTRSAETAGEIDAEKRENDEEEEER